MSKRIRRARGLAAILSLLALVTAACGGGDDSGEQGGGEESGVIVGTTDTVQTLDPAKCYSYYCSNVFQNAGNTLYTYKAGTTELVPDVASDLPEISEDGLTYTIPLESGVTFHDGSPMTSEDVAFSLKRSYYINHPEGAGFLMSGIESIDTPDDQTVVVHLTAPDITFPSKLAYTAATILPSDVYEIPDEPLGEDASVDEKESFIREEFVGTGPYRIEDFREGESLLLTAFDDYFGEAAKNDKTLIRFYEESSQLLAAMQAGEIDVAFRFLTPEQQQSLEGSDIQVIEGVGASIRYIVLNTLLEPVDDPNVRKAMAAAVDRERIVDEVLQGAGEPLYSMIPPGFEANTPSFQEVYEGKEATDFVDGKVDLTLWYSIGHYGDTEPALAQTVARSLEESGAFNVSLKSAEWAQYTSNAYPGKTGQYSAFLLGWYPDYLDPDDYIYPFYSSEQGFLLMYSNPKMNSLIKQEQTAEAPDSSARMETFAQIQQIAAEDAPIIPLYVDTPFAYAQSGISGVDQTMGPAQIFRYYLISKSGG